LNGALESAQKSLELSLAVSQADPKNAFARNAVGKAYRNLGEILAKRGDLVSAIDNYRKAAEIYEALAASDPENKEVRSAAASSYGQLGEAYMEMASKAKASAEQADHWRTARSLLRRAADGWAELQRLGALVKAYQGQPQRVADDISKCDAALSAIGRK